MIWSKIVAWNMNNHWQLGSAQSPLIFLCFWPEKKRQQFMTSKKSPKFVRHLKSTRSLADDPLLNASSRCYTHFVQRASSDDSHHFPYFSIPASLSLSMKSLTNVLPLVLVNSVAADSDQSSSASSSLRGCLLGFNNTSLFVTHACARARTNENV